MNLKHLRRIWLYANATTAIFLLLTGLYWLVGGESGRTLMWILFAILLRTYR